MSLVYIEFLICAYCQRENLYRIILSIQIGFAVQKSNKQLKNLGVCPTFASLREAQSFSVESFFRHRNGVKEG